MQTRMCRKWLWNSAFGSSLEDAQQWWSEKWLWCYETKRWHAACLAVTKLMARKCSNAMLQGACIYHQHASVSQFLVCCLPAMVHHKWGMPLLHIDWSWAEEVRWAQRLFLQIRLGLLIGPTYSTDNCSDGKSLLTENRGKPVIVIDMKMLMSSYFGRRHQTRFSELNNPQLNGSIALHDLCVRYGFTFPGGLPWSACTIISSHEFITTCSRPEAIMP